MKLEPPWRLTYTCTYTQNPEYRNRSGGARPRASAGEAFAESLKTKIFLSSQKLRALRGIYNGTTTTSINAPKCQYAKLPQCLNAKCSAPGRRGCILLLLGAWSGESQAPPPHIVTYCPALDLMHWAGGVGYSIRLRFHFFLHPIVCFICLHVNFMLMLELIKAESCRLIRRSTPLLASIAAYSHLAASSPRPRPQPLDSE